MSCDTHHSPCSSTSIRSVVGNNRGVKRDLERSTTITDTFVQINCADEIGCSRKYFVQNDNDSSVNKKTDTSHIIYFGPFLKTYLIIANVKTSLSYVNNHLNLFEIRIKPEDWARAVNQLDLKSTTKEVFNALMTVETCRVTDKDIEAHAATMLIISRAAVWMMTKFAPGSRLNPWSFPTTFPQIMIYLPPPSDQERIAIEETITNLNAALKWRNSQPPPAPNNVIEEQLDMVADSTVEELETVIDADNLYQDMAKLDAGNKEIAKYEYFFERCVEVVKGGRGDDYGKMTNAEVAAALTKSTIPQNTDVFVDAAQFGEDRWKSAFKAGKKANSILEIAKKLSSMKIRMAFKYNPSAFQSVHDICPVTLCAIYFGTKFLDNRRRMKDGCPERYDTYQPDSTEYTFPTPEECCQINESLQNYGIEILNKNKQLNGINGLTEWNSNAEVEPTMNEFTNNVAANLFENLSMFDDAAGVSGSSNSGNAVNPVEVMTPQVLPIFENVVFAINLPPNYSNVPYEAPLLDAGDAGNLSMKEMGYNREQLRSLKADGFLSGIEPKLLEDDCSETGVVLFTVLIKQSVQEGRVILKQRTHAYSKRTWGKIGPLYATRGAVVVGKQILLKQLFHKDEPRICTPSGLLRDNTADKKASKMKKSKIKMELTVSAKLNEDGQNQLMDTIRYMVGNVEVSKPELYAGPWIGMESKIYTHVIQEETKVIREKMKTSKFYEDWDWE